MEEHKNLLSDSFQQHLIESYNNYCEKYGKEPTIRGFINYLLDQDLLTPTKVRQFTICKEFDRIYPKQDYHKSKTVALLAELFNISKRYVWSLLKNYTNGERK